MPISILFQPSEYLTGFNRQIHSQKCRRWNSSTLSSLSNVLLAFGNRLSDRVHDLNSFAVEEKRNILSFPKLQPLLCQHLEKDLSFSKMPILSIVATWSSNIRRMNFSLMIFSILFISKLMIRKDCILFLLRFLIMTISHSY